MAQGSYQLEYLGTGEIEVSGVGRFGVKRFNRKTRKHEEITKLPCSEGTAVEFSGDKRFRVHGLTDGGRKAEARAKRKEVG